MKITKGLVSALVLSGFAITAWAQRGPQDNFVFEPDLAWGSSGSSNGQFTFTSYTPSTLPLGMAFDGTNVFISDWGNNRIQVFDKDGVYIRQWGVSGTTTGKFTRPSGLAIDNGFVYVVDRGNNRIQVFSKTGSFIRCWGSLGSANGQFNQPFGIAVDSNRVYVSDSVNNRIQVFDKTGEFQFAWGSSGSVAGQFSLPSSVAVDLQYVYVIDAWNCRLQVFDKTGNYVRSWGLPIYKPQNGLVLSTFGVAVDAHTVFVVVGQSGKSYCCMYDKAGSLIWQFYEQNSKQLCYPAAIAVGNPISYIFDPGYSRVLPFRRYFRTLGEQVPDAIPLADILSVNQRNGAPIIDVDYLITDANDATVTVYAAAFVVNSNATPSLADLIPMRSFVDGTATNTGPGIATGQARRLSWDMDLDGVSTKISEWGNLKTAILVKDNRGLMDLHFLAIPSIGTNLPFKISRDPLTLSDLLPLWFWLTAAGDPHVALVNGQVLGVGGAYDGGLLASGTNTTDQGRAFLFERIGVRAASATELSVAREGGMPGTLIQRTPRRQPPPAGYKVNQFNFVTYPTNGWWVVPLNP